MLKQIPTSYLMQLAGYNRAILYLHNLLLTTKSEKLKELLRFDIVWNETEKHNLLVTLSEPRMSDEDYSQLTIY